MTIFKENDKNFIFLRQSKHGSKITTVPQGLWFTVKDKFSGNVKISKLLNDGIFQNEDGSWRIEITALDTLDLASGNYVCDVKVKDEMGREFTIVKPEDFRILDVVTRRENQR